MMISGVFSYGGFSYSYILRSYFGCMPSSPSKSSSCVSEPKWLHTLLKQTHHCRRSIERIALAAHCTLAYLTQHTAYYNAYYTCKYCTLHIQHYTAGGQSSTLTTTQCTEHWTQSNVADWSIDHFRVNFNRLHTERWTRSRLVDLPL